MNSMALVESRSINNVIVDGFYGKNEAWFTREQIGKALGYDKPAKAVGKIHERHKERLDRCSTFVNLTNELQSYNLYVYNIRGVFEICRWSRQPKANAVMDKLYDMAISIMRREWNEKSSCAMKKSRSAPKLKKAEPDWGEVAMLSLNRGAYTREEYYEKLVEILGSDRKSIENEMKLYDYLRR